MNIKILLKVILLFLLAGSPFSYSSASALLVVPNALPINWSNIASSLKKKFNYNISFIKEQSYQATNNTVNSPPVIALGVKIESSDIQVSLRQDPLAVFTFLKKNVNQLTTIHIISDKEDENYAARAKFAAQQVGFNLITHEHRGDTNLAYLKAFDELNPTTDMLWIAHKIDKRVRFHLLEKSWKQKTILVSNYTADVKEGVTIGFGLDINLLEQEIFDTIQRLLSKTENMEQHVYLNKLVTSINKVAAKRTLDLIQREAWPSFDRKY